MTSRFKGLRDHRFFTTVVLVSKKPVLCLPALVIWWFSPNRATKRALWKGSEVASWPRQIDLVAIPWMTWEDK